MRHFSPASFGVRAGLLLLAALSTAALANDPDALDENPFSARVISAAEAADLVVVGRITAKRDYRPVDGGFGYDLSVSEELKGPGLSSCALRAGGWAHRVDLEVGARVLLFLKQSDAFLPTEQFSPELGPGHRPLVFRVRAGRLSAGASPGEPGWEDHSIEEVRTAIETGD